MKRLFGWLVDLSLALAPVEFFVAVALLVVRVMVYGPVTTPHLGDKVLLWVAIVLAGDAATVAVALAVVKTVKARRHRDTLKEVADR